MKRDMDLVRLILLEVEKAEGYTDIERMSCERYPLAVIGYHVELLAAHGLIDAKVEHAWGGEATGGTIKALTWSGCDYLDTVRSERVWFKAKKAVSESVGDTSLSVIKDTCSALALATIKANLGI